MTRYNAEQLLIQQVLTNNAARLVRELRELYGLSQYDVARECNFNQSRVSAIETGKYNPATSSLVEAILGIGAARARKEICDDECPCKRQPRPHTAEDSSATLLGVLAQEPDEAGHG